MPMKLLKIVSTISSKIINHVIGNSQKKSEIFFGIKSVCQRLDEDLRLPQIPKSWENLRAFGGGEFF